MDSNQQDFVRSLRPARKCQYASPRLNVNTVLANSYSSDKYAGSRLDHTVSNSSAVMVMPTNVLAIGLFAVTAAFLPTGIWFLRLKQFNPADEDKRMAIDRSFALAVGMIGAYAFLAGFDLMALEPLRAPFSEFFGAIHLYYGMVLLVGAVSVANRWDLRPASYLALIGGIMNVVYVYINETLIHNGTYPLIFIPAALVGLSAPFATHSKNVWASRITGILCIILALVTLYVGTNAIIGHIARGLKPPS